MLLAVVGGSVAAAVRRTVARLAFAITLAALGVAAAVRAPPRVRS